MPFELQGHRGARALKPENTLSSFEAALDVAVTSIETDVHLTRDGIPVLWHDPILTDALATLLPGRAEPASRALSQMTLEVLRRFRADRNPDPVRFSRQRATVGPVAESFARQRNMDPYAVPTLPDLFAFAAAYAGPLGEQAGKTKPQREAAGRLRFDLELKRVPFTPATIGDEFDGTSPGRLELRVVEEIRNAAAVERTVVRSFDHRSVRFVKDLEPRLTTGVIIAGTAPISPGEMARAAGATIFCPDYHFLDEALIRTAHAEGLRVLPWTVNRPEDWERLVRWGVDGITTDDPDQLAVWLNGHAIYWR